MVAQFLDLKSRVAPILLEGLFLLAIETLDANGKLLELFRELLSVNDFQSRDCTRPERQSLRARAKDSFKPSASS